MKNSGKSTKEYYELTVDALCKCNNIQHDIWRKQNMGVFHSMLKPDCLDKGASYRQPGLPLQRHL